MRALNQAEFDFTIIYLSSVFISRLDFILGIRWCTGIPFCTCRANMNSLSSLTYSFCFFFSFFFLKQLPSFPADFYYHNANPHPFTSARHESTADFFLAFVSSSGASMVALTPFPIPVAHAVKGISSHFT